MPNRSIFLETFTSTAAAFHHVGALCHEQIFVNVPATRVRSGLKNIAAPPKRRESTQTRLARPVIAEMKARQSAKIQELGQALIDAGLCTLDEQANALGLPRSTAWTILKARHKNYGLSVKLINRMLASQHLPPLVRSKIIEYREEKTAGLYGGPQHSKPDLPQANRAYGGSPARRKVP